MQRHFVFDNVLTNMTNATLADQRRADKSAKTGNLSRTGTTKQHEPFSTASM